MTNTPNIDDKGVDRVDEDDSTALPLSTKSEASKNKTNDSPFPDIEPMIVLVNENAWTNPFINTWYKATSNSNLWDPTYHFIRYENEDEDELVVIFKSKLLEQKRDQYLEDSIKPFREHGYEVFEPPYVDMELMCEVLETVLTEENWCALPNPDPQYNIIRKLYPAERFSKTEVGKMTKSFFDDSEEPVIEFFSLYASLIYENGLWGFRYD